MFLDRLALTNYRNHKDLKVEFSSEISLITGLNGSGKTNILEAIHFLSTTKSFRAKYDIDLITHNEDFALVKAKIKKNGTTEDLEIQVVKSKKDDNRSVKKVKFNNVSKKLSSFTSKFTTVLFSPESLNIITGSPSLRRNYLDSIFFQVDESYKKDSSLYKKALKQRNKVLELISLRGQGQSQLPYWNEKILTLGNKIQEKRVELFSFLKEFLGKDGKDLYKVTYDKNIISSQKVDDYYIKELAAKRTLVGPHLDDFMMYSSEGELDQFGSRGQQREAIFILKLAEIGFLQAYTGEKPVLLLDDIFSELDNIHREKVLSLVNEQQTIITSAENVRESFHHVLLDKVIRL